MRVVAALGCLGAAKVVNVAVPFLLRESVDALSGADAVAALPVAAILAYGAARLLAKLFGEFRDLLFVRVGQHAQREVGLQTFEHLHALPLEFHLARRTGDVSRVIERGVRGIQYALSFMTFNIVPTIFELAMVTAILLYNFHWKYGAIVSGTIAIYVIATLVVTEWRLKHRKRMNAAESEANSKAIDSLLNYETVKYFANEQHELERFDRNLRSYESSAISNQHSLSILNLAQSVIVGLGLVGVMLFAGRDVVAGTMTVGDFVLVNSFLIQLYLPLDFLGYVYREMKQSLVDADRMFELLDITSTVQDEPGAPPLRVGAGKVEFRDVTFGYAEVARSWTA